MSSHRGRWCRRFLRRQPTMTHMIKQKATTPQMTATEMKSSLFVWPISPGVGGGGVTKCVTRREMDTSDIAVYGDVDTGMTLSPKASLGRSPSISTIRTQYQKVDWLLAFTTPLPNLSSANSPNYKLFKNLIHLNLKITVTQKFVRHNMKIRKAFAKVKITGKKHHYNASDTSYIAS